MKMWMCGSVIKNMIGGSMWTNSRFLNDRMYVKNTRGWWHSQGLSAVQCSQITSIVEKMNSMEDDDIDEDDMEDYET